MRGHGRSILFPYIAVSHGQFTCMAHSTWSCQLSVVMCHVSMQPVMRCEEQAKASISSAVPTTSVASDTHYPDDYGGGITYRVRLTGSNCM
jgi:hypothetical protein